jgi:predicted RNA binding protein YcfA (HicA-like mRNA interferase family)
MFAVLCSQFPVCHSFLQSPRVVRQLLLAQEQAGRHFCRMPRKIRQLIADLQDAGFFSRGGKGSHRNFVHPKGVLVTLSGNPGDDAKHYQEKLVRTKINQTRP